MAVAVLRILTPVAIVLLAIPRAGRPIRDAAVPDPNAIDRLVTEKMRANGIPGLAIAITHGDEVIYTRGYGTAGDDQSVTPRTQFFVASLSKSFTAVAVMQLAEKGKISLDEPVRTYLPRLRTSNQALANRTTVRDLLNQTTGLADQGYPAYTLDHPDSPRERVASLDRARFISMPGAEFHYFNPNYEVLARLVEVTSDEDFDVYLQRHVLTPLEMNDTTSGATSQDVAQSATTLAQGHILTYGAAIPHDELDGYLGGSGGIVSTAEDMANYLIMQNLDGRFGDRRLLSPESVALMHSPPDDIKSSYGMGWFVSDSSQSPRVVEHNGVLSSFHADAVLLPDQGYGIVLLYNFNHAFADYNGLKEGVIDLLIGAEPTGGGLDAGTVGSALAVITLITAGVQIRALRRVSRWGSKARTKPLWRLIPGIVWKFVPISVLLMLPSLMLLATGRAYTHEQLFLAMPEVAIWLLVSSALGVSLAGAHLVEMVRSGRAR